MTEIRINGKLTAISDENEELYVELIHRIVNEDYGSENGDADFDSLSSNNDATIISELKIDYKIDDNADQLEMFNSEPE